jgi:hypothetical protein
MKTMMEVTIKLRIPLYPSNYEGADPKVKEWTPDKMLEYERKNLDVRTPLLELDDNPEVSMKLME